MKATMMKLVALALMAVVAVSAQDDTFETNAPADTTDLAPTATDMPVVSVTDTIVTDSTTTETETSDSDSAHPLREGLLPLEPRLLREQLGVEERQQQHEQGVYHGDADYHLRDGGRDAQGPLRGRRRLERRHGLQRAHRARRRRRRRRDGLR
ncbi:hypothetical protein EV715DRAFT_250646, partial [Schizophyllum commune]